MHTIHLFYLGENYSTVKDAANHQRCLVIFVIKADGYGDGSMQTTTFLADKCGANAFNVANLEEAIAIRRDLNYGFTCTMEKAVAAGGRGEGYASREGGLIRQ